MTSIEQEEARIKYEKEQEMLAEVYDSGVVPYSSEIEEQSLSGQD